MVGPGSQRQTWGSKRAAHIQNWKNRGPAMKPAKSLPAARPSQLHPTCRCFTPSKSIAPVSQPPGQTRPWAYNQDDLEGYSKWTWQTQKKMRCTLLAEILETGTCTQHVEPNIRIAPPTKYTLLYLSFGLLTVKVTSET